jgi:hypothetical protein
MHCRAEPVLVIWQRWTNYLLPDIKRGPFTPRSTIPSSSSTPTIGIGNK